MMLFYSSFASFSFTAHPSQVSHFRLILAWAILRIRYPVLASVGLVDSTGKVSFSYVSLRFILSVRTYPFTRYDGFSNPSSAIADAETSLELRQDLSESDLVASYLAGTRRVSRSHLSHLYFSSSTGDSSPVLSKPLTPPISEHDRAYPQSQYSFLLCTPHYVADRKLLTLRLEELVSILTSVNPPSETDLQEEISRAQKLLYATQSQNPISIRTPVSPIKMNFPLTGRFQRAAVVTQEVVCQ